MFQSDLLKMFQVNYRVGSLEKDTQDDLNVHLVNYRVGSLEI